MKDGDRTTACGLCKFRPMQPRQTYKERVCDLSPEAICLGLCHPSPIIMEGWQEKCELGPRHPSPLRMRHTDPAHDLALLVPHGDGRVDAVSLCDALEDTKEVPWEINAQCKWYLGA